MLYVHFLYIFFYIFIYFLYIFIFNRKEARSRERARGYRRSVTTLAVRGNISQIFPFDLSGRTYHPARFLVRENVLLRGESMENAGSRMQALCSSTKRRIARALGAA